MCLIKFVGFVNFCGPKDWEVISILILNFSVTLQYLVPQCLDCSWFFWSFIQVSNSFCCNSYLEIILYRIIYLGKVILVLKKHFLLYGFRVIFMCSWRGMKNSHPSNRKPGETSSSALWSCTASCYIPGIALGCKQSSSRDRPWVSLSTVEHNLAIAVKFIL